MKRLSVTLMMLVTLLCLQAQTTYTLRGTEFRADTVFYAQIGPGTTQTSLHLYNETGRQMNVFYSTIDLTNPFVTIRTVAGQDKYYGCEKTSSMAERKSQPGARYFLGINADFYLTAGYTGRGESLVGVPCGSSVVDGEFFTVQTNDYYTEFAFDANKMPRIGSAHFGGSMADTKGHSVPMGGVNADARDNEIWLYNSYYYAGTNQWGDAAEVQARLADGETIVVGKPFKLVVTGECSTAGDMDVPADGFVIHGQGNADFGGITALDFVKNLQRGDTVSAVIRVTMGGEEIFPEQVISGFPKSLDNATVTETEWMLDEFSTNQPVTELGIADGGKKIIMIVIDGRSPISSGCRTTEVADLLRQLGVTEAINFDSGGSTTFYTSALGIRNRCSDGVERANANGVFAVSTAPDDSVVAKIAFVDWSKTIPKYGAYTPQFYGYNRYGMLIDTDLQGVTIACDEGIGSVKEGITFIGSGSGTGFITAHLGDMEAQLPVKIVGSSSGLRFVSDTIINDAYRDYAVVVTNTVDGVTMPIDPSALAWTSSDETIVAIDNESSVLHGLADGIAEVIGSIDEFKDTLIVKVEKPTAHVMPIDPNLDPATWKFSHTGGKNGVAIKNGDGFDYSYTGASGRAPKLAMTKDVRLWSLPDTLRMRFNPGEAPVKNVQFALRPNGGKLVYQTITPDTIIPNLALTIDLPTNVWLDADDMSNYPIMLTGITLNMNAAVTGKEYTMRFLGFETVYNAVEPAVNVRGDVDRNGTVNVSDVTELVNMILDITPLNAAVADVDDNGTVNVSDVTELVNIILGM